MMNTPPASSNYSSALNLLPLLPQCSPFLTPRVVPGYLVVGLDDLEMSLSLAPGPGGLG